MIIIAIENGIIQEIYNDNPNEFVLIRDLTETVYTISTQTTRSLTSVDPTVWDMPKLRRMEQTIKLKKGG